MLFGFDGIEISLLITFICLLCGILTGYPVAMALAGSAIISFGIIAGLASTGFLMKEVVDTGSAQYAALLAQGVIVREMSAWKLSDCLRVTIGTMSENRTFIRALKRCLRK